MNTDSNRDSYINIKACFTLCIWIISTTKTRGIIPETVGFFLSEAVNIIVIVMLIVLYYYLPVTLHSYHNISYRVGKFLLTINWNCLHWVLSHLISLVEERKKDLKTFIRTFTICLVFSGFSGHALQHSFLMHFHCR